MWSDASPPPPISGCRRKNECRSRLLTWSQDDDGDGPSGTRAPTGKDAIGGDDEDDESYEIALEARVEYEKDEGADVGDAQVRGARYEGVGG